MKALYLSREQAKSLGEDLVEYAAMKDVSDRDLFTGFKILFGDMLGDSPHDDQTLELHPIADYKEVEGSSPIHDTESDR